jgi:hypothetical protein
MVTARTSQRGYTLLHVLAYTALLAVVINLGLTNFVSATRLNTRGAGILDDLWAFDRMATGFRATVAASTRVVDELGAYRTSDDTLVLETAAIDGAARYAVLTLAPVDGADHLRLHVLRAVERDGALQPLDYVVHRWPFETGHFVVTDGPRRSVRLEATGPGAETARVITAAAWGRGGP